MKLINRIIEDIMPRKRGSTKFINTNKIAHWDKFEVTDVQ